MVILILSSGATGAWVVLRGNPHGAQPLDPAAGWGVDYWNILDVGPVCSLKNHSRRICPDKPPWARVFDLGVPTFVRKPYDWIVMRRATLATVVPAHVHELHDVMIGPKQAFLAAPGWRPFHQKSAYPYWPVKGYKLPRRIGKYQDGGTLVMSFRADRPGVYTFRRPTISGTAYTRRRGHVSAVPFRQTFNWEWGFCVGYTDAKCKKIASAKRLGFH